MKSIISINNLFMDLTPRDLVELIMNSKYTKGVEANIDANNKYELDYLDKLVFELKKNDLILQVHGDMTLELEKQLEFLKLLEKYADDLNYPIVFTIHSMIDDDSDIALKKTIEYISELINKIGENKIIICLENLNNIDGMTRLGRNDIRKYIINDEKLYFTYDLGHELSDYGNLTDIDEYLQEDIRNIHIHSHDNQGHDHMPIYRNDLHWNDIMKGLSFLIINHYRFNIVYEYSINYCKGNTLEEKVMDYLDSIDLVSERYAGI